MIVKGSRNGLVELPLRAVLEDFKTNQPREWTVLCRLYGEKQAAEDALREFFTPFHTDGKNHYLATVRESASEMIRKHIEKLNAKRAFKHDYVFDQLQVQVLSQEATFPRGIQWSRVGEKCQIQTNCMKLSAKVAVRTDQKLEADKWRVGFVQTIMRLERRVIITKDNSKGVWKTWLAGPCKDGPKDYTEAWYDPGAVSDLQQKKFQVVEISMMDQPGIAWNQRLDETIESVDGGEVFRTWLAMQRTDNKSKVKFLRMWQWHVDYTIATQNISRFGIAYDGYQENSDGSGAVITGSTGKNILDSKFEQEQSNSLTFDEIRKSSGLKY